MEMKEEVKIKSYIKENYVENTSFGEQIMDFVTDNNLKTLVENIGVSLIGGVVGSAHNIEGKESRMEGDKTKPDADKFELWMAQQMEDNDSFQRVSLKYLETKGYKDNYPEFYKKIGMNRQLFSKLLSEKDNQQPEKKSVFKLMIGLELDLRDADKLLQSAGYNFNCHKIFDMIIKYCVENGIYKPEKVDEYLVYFDEKPLFSIGDQ